MGSSINISSRFTDIINFPPQNYNLSFISLLFPLVSGSKCAAPCNIDCCLVQVPTSRPPHTPNPTHQKCGRCGEVAAALLQKAVQSDGFSSAPTSLQAGPHPSLQLKPNTLTSKWFQMGYNGSGSKRRRWGE